MLFSTTTNIVFTSDGSLLLFTIGNESCKEVSESVVSKTETLHKLDREAWAVMVILPDHG